MNPTNFKEILNVLTEEEWPKEETERLLQNIGSEWLGRKITSTKIKFSLHGLMNIVSSFVQAHPEVVTNEILSKFFKLEHKLEVLNTDTSLLRSVLSCFQLAIAEPITLSMGDQGLQMPRGLLASRSSYFDRMLTSGFSEGSKRDIVLNDSHDPLVVRAFLSYLQMGNVSFVNISSDNVVDLLDMANFYDVHSLHQICQNWLIFQLTKNPFIADRFVLKEAAQATHASLLMDFLTNLENDINDANDKLPEIITSYAKAIISADELALLREKGKFLNELKVYYGITKWDFINLIEFCPNVTALDINTEWLGDAELECALDRLPYLRKISFNYSISSLTDRSLFYIAEKCPDLEVLQIPGVEFITSQTVRAISQACSKLVNLAIFPYNLVDSTALFELGRLRNLRALHINGGNFYDETLKFLADRLIGLTALSLSSCSHLTGASILYAAQKFRGTLKEFGFFLNADAAVQILPLLAIELTELETLELKVKAPSEIFSEFISSLQNLRKLTIHGSSQDISTFQALTHLKHFQSLHLMNCHLKVTVSQLIDAVIDMSELMLIEIVQSTFENDMEDLSPLRKLIESRGGKFIYYFYR